MSHDQASQPQPAQLLELVAYQYRSLVVRRLDVTLERHGLSWLAATACSHTGAASEETCSTCVVWDEYLTAALSSDDAQRHPLPRDPEEVHLWIGLERTSTAQRDLELVRLDFGALESDTPVAPTGDYGGAGA